LNYPVHLTFILTDL